MQARLLLLAILAAVAVPGAARGGDLVMNYSSTSGFDVQTQTLDGVVQARMSVPMLPLRPAPLPDGGAVFAGGEAAPGIWRLHPNGVLSHLTTGPWDADPSATRDGTRVVFDRFDPVSNTKDLYVVNGDGTGLRRLTNGNGAADYAEPVFSPDGSTIAYLCNATAAQWGQNCGPQADGGAWFTGVMLMNADGTQPRLIFRGQSWDPAWSNDGQWLAVIATINVSLGGGVWTGYPELYVVKTDGSDLFADERRERYVPTSDDPASMFLGQPSFSGDGARLVFWATTLADGTQAAYVVGRDGSGLRKLTLDGFPYALFVPPMAGGGPPPFVDATHVVVPTVASLSPLSARRKLTGRHLGVIGVVKRYSAKIRRGRVLAVRPRAGTKLHRPNEAYPLVTLYVSKGRKPKPRRHHHG